jgi:hypothetical protein
MAHSVSLSWTASTDSVNGYDVYRGTGPGAEGTVPINVTLITGTTYIDTAPVIGQNYYVVKASENSVLSVASNEILASIAPAAPTGLTLVSSS